MAKSYLTDEEIRQATEEFLKLRRQSRTQKRQVDRRDVFEKLGDFIYEDAPTAVEKFADKLFGFDE